MQEKSKSAGYTTGIPLLGKLYIRESLRFPSLERLHTISYKQLIIANKMTRNYLLLFEQASVKHININPGLQFWQQTTHWQFTKLNSCLI